MVTVLVTINGVYPPPTRFLACTVLVEGVCVELCRATQGEKCEDEC